MKQTIAELEAILDGKGGGRIYIAPNGELKNYPVKGSKKDAQRHFATKPMPKLPTAHTIVEAVQAGVPERLTGREKGLIGNAYLAMVRQLSA